MVNYLLRTSLRLLDTIYVSTCMKIFFSHYISEENIFHIIINNYYSATTFLTQYSFQSVPIHIKKIQKFRGGGEGGRISSTTWNYGNSREVGVVINSIKVFRYSFSESTPKNCNYFKSDLSLSDCYGMFSTD